MKGGDKMEEFKGMGSQMPLVDASVYAELETRLKIYAHNNKVSFNTALNIAVLKGLSELEE